MPAHLIEFFSGWEKHNSLLVHAIKPLDAAQLSWKAAPEQWDVRMLANHIVGARSWWFNGHMGEGGDGLALLMDFDERADAEKRDAAEICAALNDSWNVLDACLRKWTEADLKESFQRPSPNREGERPSRTRQYIVWHVAEHDVHHGGEISLILGMHGLAGLDL